MGLFIPIPRGEVPSFNIVLPNRHQPCKFSVSHNGARWRTDPWFGIPLDPDFPPKSLRGWMLLLPVGAHCASALRALF